MALLKIKRKGDRGAFKVMDDSWLKAYPPLAGDAFGISEEAASHIEGLLADRPNAFLRVSIRGGGCSGFSIHYEVSDLMRAGDRIFSQGKAKIAIDQKSLAILGGSTIHCREHLGAKEFLLLNNPAHKQCSCGQSFSL